MRALDVERLTSRILDLLPEHPEIMDMVYPGDLFKLDGFMIDDLRVSVFQAQLALDTARERILCERARP